MKFLLDAMLGTLARWLRMMGHDVAYSTKLGDDELQRLAKAETRVLLTTGFRALPPGPQKRLRGVLCCGQNPVKPPSRSLSQIRVPTGNRHEKYAVPNLQHARESYIQRGARRQVATENLPLLQTIL